MGQQEGGQIEDLLMSSRRIKDTDKAKRPQPGRDGGGQLEAHRSEGGCSLSWRPREVCGLASSLIAHAGPHDS